MFLIEIGTVDNILKVVYSNNMPSSQTFTFKYSVSFYKFFDFFTM
jgi:hypothetical protein